MKIKPVKNASQGLSSYLLLETEPLELYEGQMDYVSDGRQFYCFDECDSLWTYSDGVISVFSVGSILEENAIQKSQVSLQRSRRQ